MTILQANKFFYEKGGSERYFFALSRALEARGHRVVHFAMSHPRNLPSPDSRHFVPQRDYAGGVALRSLGAVVSFVRSRDAARRVRALTAESKPDVAHLHNVYHQLTPSIIPALTARGIPVVMTLHDYKLVCPSYGMFAHGAYCYRCRGARFYHAVTTACAGSRARSALLAIESYWQRWTRVYDGVSCFVAPSEYLRRVMIEAGISPERVVHVAPLNPASARNEPPGTLNARFLDALPPRCVAYVGRLSAEKGVRVLLEAAAYTPEIPVVIFGEGPQASELRESASRRGLANVIFAGHAPAGVIGRALARAVAVVLPTLSPENAPMAILEAADAGVPVIVSDRGGLPEMSARLGGRVVPAGDAAALAGAMREAWQDEEQWKARARAAWGTARGTHASGAHAQAMEAIYRRVIERRRAAA